MGDEIILQNIWGVLTQDAKTGTWSIRSVHKSRLAADAMCDRETLRVIELECHQLGVPAAFAMEMRDAGIREERARIVAWLRGMAQSMAYGYARLPGETRRLEMVARDIERGEHEEKANG